MFPIQFAWLHAPGEDYRREEGGGGGNGPSNHTALWDATESLLIILCAVQQTE